MEKSYLCKSTFSSIKYHSKLRNFDFKINYDYVSNLFIEQNGRCALTGWKINLKRGKRNVWWRQITASLDRINSCIGYIPNNIQWVHKDVNLSKNYLDQQRYFDLCFLVFNYNKIKVKEINVEIWNRKTKLKGIGNLGLTKWTDIKRSAKKRGIDFNLSIEDGWGLYVEQKCRCALSNVPIYFALPGGFNNDKNYILQNNESTASLDRIDSNYGYELNNVQWVHKDVNLIKLKFNSKYFYNICKFICIKNKPTNDVDKLLEPIDFVIDNDRQKKSMNKILPKGKFKGVYQIPSGKFCSKIRNLHLGYFDNAVLAAQNYDYYAIKIFGDKCYLNFKNKNYSGFEPKKLFVI